MNKQVEGLKKKNSELLGKIKDYQSTTNEIKSEAEKAKEEALKKAGDIEKYKKFADEKIENIQKEADEKITALMDKIKNGEKQEVINKLVGLFVNSETANYMLKGLVDVEDGNQQFKDFTGKIVADNIDDYKNWIKTNPDMAHLVRGTDASGGNAVGGKATSNSKSISKSEWASYDAAKKMEVAKDLSKAGLHLNDILIDE